MEKMTEKQTKKRSKAWIVLLVLLLLLAGAAGYLYCSVVKAPLTPDDPEALAASAPMTVRERFQFHSADQSAQVKIDTRDIWSMILEHAGTDFMDSINSRLSDYGVSVSGCAIGIDSEGLALDLELSYKDVRLVAKVPCELTVTGKHVSLKPSAVKLGVLSLPVGKLLSGVKLEYDIDLPVMDQVTQVAFVEGAVVLSGPMEQSIRTLVPVDETLYWTAVFSETMQPLADALQTTEGYASLMEQLEEDPGSVEDLYRQLFTLAEPEAVSAYLESRHGLTERFFPGIDFSAVAEAHSAMTEQVNGQGLILEKFFTNLAGDYNDKKFTLSGGEFLMKKKPFEAARYSAGKYDELFEVLDPGAVFLILVDAEDGFIRKTSSLYRMCGEDQEFTQSVDFNKTYILGCVFRSVDGDPFLLYNAEIRQSNTYTRHITLRPLTEEDVEALQVPGKFGVWTG